MNLIALIIEILLLLSIVLTFIEDSKISVTYWGKVIGNVFDVVKGIGKLIGRTLDEFRVKASDVNRTIALTNHNISNVTGG